MTKTASTQQSQPVTSYLVGVSARKLPCHITHSGSAVFMTIKRKVKIAGDGTYARKICVPVAPDYSFRERARRVDLSRSLSIVVKPIRRGSK